VGSRLGLNSLRGERRRRQREGRIILEQNPEVVPLEETVLRQEAVRRVRKVLEALPTRDRLALLLRQSGFTYREISGSLDVAPGSVGTILARAQRSFVALWRQNNGGEDDVL